MKNQEDVKDSLWGIKVENVPLDSKVYLQQHPSDKIDLVTPQIASLGKGSDVNKHLANLKYILEDIVAGDSNALNRPEFQALNFPAIKKALEWLIKTDQLSNTAKASLLTDAWRLNFKIKPPTPEEFLTEKYIGAQAETLYAPVKKAFIEAMDPLAPYRNVILSLHIGFGKSLLTVLINLYIAVHFALMWHPWKFFGQSPATVYTQTFCAWSLKKGSELLLEPMMQLLEASPYFKKIRTHSEMIELSHDEEIEDQMLYTSASKTSALSIQNGANFKLISSPGGLLGQTIISGSMTELSFFTDEGWSDEQILKFFTKLRQRIDSRMKGNYYGRFILDSSPNSLESVIDDWIWNSAPKDPKNYILTGSRWKYFPQDFPEFYDKDKKEKHDFINGFPLYKGGNGVLSKVVENENELSSYESQDIIWCPVKQITNSGVVNFRDGARENPIEFMRDYCGMPSGAADRILYNREWITHAFDTPLKNVFASIIALTEDEPEHLIWNQIKDIFFIKLINKYYYYYEPSLPRVASVDLSISGDAAAISVSHVERDMTRVDAIGQPLKVYVTDFTIPVIPKGGLINLDAFKFFIIDLITLGNMNIRHVSFDGFQSVPIRQALIRAGITVDYISVDKETAPYLSFIDYVTHKRWYCGKNIMLKNNLLALQMTKRKTSKTTKIDHSNGDLVFSDNFCPHNGFYTENAWNNSRIGQNAKDVADAVCANINLLDLYADEFPMLHAWNPIAELERTYDSEFNKTKEIMQKLNLIL